MLQKLFLTFLKIGFLGFGGGYAMLSLIFEEMMDFGMTVEQYADLNALDVLIPGPIAINSATYVGQLYAGFSGALVTTIAVCIPSFVFVNLFCYFEKTIRKSQLLTTILNTIKVISIGLIFAVALTLVLATCFNMESWQDLSNFHFDLLSFLIMSLTIFLHLRFKINPLLLTLAAGLLGYLTFYF